MTKQQEDQDRTDLAVIKEQVGTIKTDVKDIKSTLALDYVTKDQLLILKGEVNRLSKIVFGIIGVVSTALGLGLIGAFLNAILRKP